MLRNRSKAMTTKKALIPHQIQNSLLSPKKQISTFLDSPRIFNGLLPKSPSHAEITIMSPTSTLDTKNSSNFDQYPFVYKQKLTKIIDNKKSKPKAIGLALIDSLIEEKSDYNFSKPINRMALFGSKLKIQIPAINPSPGLYSPVESPKSPADFGIKTKNCQTLSPFCEAQSKKEFTRQLSLKEMELSEDYTCVITHGPKPKTTHIFGDCIVKENVKSGDPNIDFHIHCHEYPCEEMDFYGIEKTKVG